MMAASSIRPWLWVAVALVGCGPSGEVVDRTLDDGEPLPRRAGALVIDACPMDSFQRSTLAADATRAVIDEVVLLCLYAKEDGTVEPAHELTAGWLRDDIQAAKAAGYRVHLGLTAGEGNLSWYTAQQSTELLLDEAWRTKVIEGASAWAQASDGLEVALPAPVENRARPGVLALIDGLSSRLRPARSVGVFVPPSVSAPSDLEGGDAYNLTALASRVDRLRVMTLDFSCCSRPGGPSTDPGWATDAVRFAIGEAPEAKVSVTMPLFGTDFSDLGSRSVTYLEAASLAGYHEAKIERGPTGAPHFSYTDGSGRGHELWFDDVFSTRVTLGAWSKALPADVAVLYYGLGAEEPGLWAELARSMSR